MTRVLTGLALAILVLSGVRWAPLWLFWSVVGLVVVLATHELCVILESAGRGPWRVVAQLGALGIAAGFLVPEPPLLALVAVFVCLVCLRGLASGEEPAFRLDRILGTLFAGLYVGLALGHVGGLLSCHGPAARERGEDLLILAIVVVYFGDTAAYYGGRAWGRHRLAPRLSPKKTWEGAVSGLLGGVAGALLGSIWFFQALSWPHALAIGFVLGVAAIAGDLLESLLKRAAGVKDSGTLLPGHGGVLDRIDSLLLAGPALFWYHRLLLSGG